MDYMAMTLILFIVSVLSLHMGRRMPDGWSQRVMIITGKLFLGAVLLVIVNLLGEQFGIRLPVNPFCSALAGLLGAPGVALLVALKLLLI